MVAENRVGGRVVIAARRQQIVEEEPVAIGVIQGVDLDFVWFGDAPESAPVVDQVAGHQQDVGAFLHFPVGGLEAPVEVVVAVLAIGQDVGERVDGLPPGDQLFSFDGGPFAGGGEVPVVDIRPDIDMGVGDVADAKRGLTMPPNEQRMQDLGGDRPRRPSSLVIRRMQCAVLVAVFVHEEVEIVGLARSSCDAGARNSPGAWTSHPTAATHWSARCSRTGDIARGPSLPLPPR